MAPYMKTKMCFIATKFFELISSTKENALLYVRGSMFSIYVVDRNMYVNNS